MEASGRRVTSRERKEGRRKGWTEGEKSKRNLGRGEEGMYKVKKIESVQLFSAGHFMK